MVDKKTVVIAAFMILTFAVMCEATSSLFLIQASSGTEVGGIIEENTTWTLECSPYVLTEIVQIPTDVVLTIEPGVTIISHTPGSSFYFSGTIIAYGTNDEKIIFTGNPEYWFTSVTHRSAELYLEHCIIEGPGQLFYRGFRFFILRNSTLSDIDAPMTLGAYGGNITIEYCSFINTGGIIAGGSSPIYIKYNLFMNTTYHLIRGWYYTQTPKTIFKYNSFINLKPYDPENVVGYFSGLDITENYWGTNDTEKIDIMMRDRNDWISIPGYIDYLPILNEPHPDTPQAPPLTPPPKLAEFVLSDLSITPSEVEPGDEVTISVVVSNVGELPGSYTVILRRVEDVGDEAEVTLDGGASETILFTYKMDVEGTYHVEVDGLTGSFTVKEPPTPASFEIYDLQVHPRDPNGGEIPEDLSIYPARIEVEGEDDVWTFRVGVNVTNTGELEGKHTVELEINGSIVDSKTLTLAGGEDTRILFEVERGIGTYQVDVDGLKDSFEVVLMHKPSFWDKIPGFPYESIILGLIAVIIIFWRFLSGPCGGREVPTIKKEMSKCGK